MIEIKSKTSVEQQELIPEVLRAVFLSQNYFSIFSSQEAIQIQYEGNENNDLCSILGICIDFY